MVPASDVGTFENVSVSLPDASLVQCEAPEVVYRRSFNRPTGLEAKTVVMLVSDLLILANAVRLNDQPLSATSGEVEITPLLRTHNELLVTLQRDAYRAASQAVASLQIIEPA